MNTNIYWDFLICINVLLIKQNVKIIDFQTIVILHTMTKQVYKYFPLVISFLIKLKKCKYAVCCSVIFS